MLTELANSSSDPDHRFVAARGLALFGPALHPDALNTARALLADPATPLSTRCDAAGFLGELAPDSIEEAVQILRELAADPEARADDLRKAAHNLLTISSSSDADAATWLIAALNDVTAESWTDAASRKRRRPEDWITDRYHVLWPSPMRLTLHRLTLPFRGPGALGEATPVIGSP